MSMAVGHPLSSWGSNLWRSIGLEDSANSWCACFNPTYHPTTQNPVIAVRVPDCNTPPHRVSAGRVGVDEQSAHGVSNGRPLTTPDGTPAGCICLIGGGDELDDDGSYWTVPTRFEDHVTNAVSTPPVAPGLSMGGSPSAEQHRRATPRTPVSSGGALSSPQRDHASPSDITEDSPRHPLSPGPSKPSRPLMAEPTNTDIQAAAAQNQLEWPLPNVDTLDVDDASAFTASLGAAVHSVVDAAAAAAAAAVAATEEEVEAADNDSLWQVVERARDRHALSQQVLNISKRLRAAREMTAAAAQLLVVDKQLEEEALSSLVQTRSSSGVMKVESAPLVESTPLESEPTHALERGLAVPSPSPTRAFNSIRRLDSGLLTDLSPRDMVSQFCSADFCEHELPAYCEFEVRVVRERRGDRLGMDVKHDGIPPIRILSISEGDAVDRANERSRRLVPPGPTLEVGDFIVEVNDVMEPITRMVSELAAGSDLRIVAFRILDEENSGVPVVCNVPAAHELDEDAEAIQKSLSVKALTFRIEPELLHEAFQKGKSPSLTFRIEPELPKEMSQVRSGSELPEHVPQSPKPLPALPMESRARSSESPTQASATQILETSIPPEREGSTTQAQAQQACDAAQTGVNHEVGSHSPCARLRDATFYPNMLGRLQGIGCPRELSVSPSWNAEFAHQFAERASGNAAPFVPSIPLVQHATAQTAEVAVQADDDPHMIMSDLSPSRPASETQPSDSCPTPFFGDPDDLGPESQEVSPEQSPTKAERRLGEDAMPISLSNVLAQSWSDSCLGIRSREALAPLAHITKRSVFSDKYIEEVRSAKQTDGRSRSPARAEKEVRSAKQTDGRSRSPARAEKVTKLPREPSPLVEATPPGEPHLFSPKKAILPMVAQSRPTLQWAFEDTKCCTPPRSPLASARPSRELGTASPARPYSYTWDGFVGEKKLPKAPEVRSVSEPAQTSKGAGKRLEQPSDAFKSLQLLGTAEPSGGAEAREAPEVRSVSEPAQTSKGADEILEKLSNAFKSLQLPGAAEPSGGAEAPEAPEVRSVSEPAQTSNGGDERLDKPSDAFTSIQLLGAAEPSGGAEAPEDLPEELKKAFAKAWDVVHSPARLTRTQRSNVFASLLGPSSPANALVTESPAARTPTPTRSARTSTLGPHLSLSKRTGSPKIVFRAEDVVGEEEVIEVIDEVYAEIVQSPRSCQRASAVGSSGRSLPARTGSSLKSPPRLEASEAAEQVVHEAITTPWSGNAKRRASSGGYLPTQAERRRISLAAPFPKLSLPVCSSPKTGDWPHPPAETPVLSTRAECNLPAASSVSRAEATQRMSTGGDGPAPSRNSTGSVSSLVQSDTEFSSADQAFTPRKSLSKRTQSPQVMFKLEECIDELALVDAEESEFVRICHRWSRKPRTSSASRGKQMASSKERTTICQRSVSLPRLPTMSRSSKALVSPRSVTGNMTGEAMLRAELVVSQEEFSEVIDREFAEIIERWSMRTWRLSSSSSSARCKAQKIVILCREKSDYQSPKRVAFYKRARSLPMMVRADSLGRPIEKNGNHHCRFVDESDTGTPVHQVFEFQVSSISRPPTSKYIRRVFSDD